MILLLPFLGTLIQKYEVRALCRSLGMILEAGSTLDQALIAIRKIPHNSCYQQLLTTTYSAVLEGQTISTVFKNHHNIVPELAIQMIETGEQAGTLSETLLYIGEHYEEEIADITKNISSLLEPALMICMGCIVGFIAISMITPIYAITQNIKH